ncbi:zinc finger domain-containing protein [Mycobacterium pinniadriaticum]
MNARVPVRAAYEQYDALRRDCPMCDAGPGQWCITPRGRLRRVPCVLRTRTPL